MPHKLPLSEGFVFRPELDDICRWWDRGTPPAIALLGASGTGKTSLLAEFLTGVPCKVFIWDFRQSKEIPLFFKKLTDFLAIYASEDCLIVLDSLDEVQSRTKPNDYRDYLIHDDLVGALQGLIQGYGRCRLIFASQKSVDEFPSQKNMPFQQLFLGEVGYEQATDFLRGSGILGTGDEISELVEKTVGKTKIIVLAALATTLKKQFNGHASSYDPANPQAEAALWDSLLIEILNSNRPENAARFFGEGSRFSYFMLGLKEPDYERGQRIHAALMERLGIPQELHQMAVHEGLLYALHDYSLFAADTGLLQIAESALRHILVTWKDGYRDLLMARQNLADVLVLMGRLPEAEYMAETAVRAFSDPIHGSGLLYHLGVCDSAGSRTFPQSGSNPYARRAHARALQGRVTLALEDFQQAALFQHMKSIRNHRLISSYHHLAAQLRESGETVDERVEKIARLYDRPKFLIGRAALHYADLLVRLGKLGTAAKVAEYHLREQRTNAFPLIMAHAGLILSDVYRLSGKYEEADTWLRYPLSWAQESGQKEILCQAQLRLGRLRMAQKQEKEALAAVIKTYEAAVSSGFKVIQIDSLITWGRLLLEHQLEEAEQKTQTALEMAEDIDCNYGWGRGSALQLLGEIRMRQADRHSSAQLFLENAAAVRRAIHDPRLSNTMEWLAKIPPKEKK